MPERVRITGKNEGVYQNEGIDAQVEQDGSLRVRSNPLGGSVSHRKVSVTDTESEVTVTAGKLGVTIQNIGSKILYIGGTGLDPSTPDYGISLVPRQQHIFGAVKSDFSFYVVCASGESTTLGVLEYA